jgi:transcriptional regulator with XRE-family HTH domain
MGKKTIPNSLWTYRKKIGLSQKRVAFFLAHKTSSQLSNYERGKKLPGLANALKLEVIYQVPVAFLYRDLYQKVKEEVEGKKARLRILLVEE